AFTKRKNAVKRLEAVKNAGFKDAYILTDEVNVNSDGGYAILGHPYLCPHHMNQYVTEINADAIELGQYYLTLGSFDGMSGDIVFAQAMHETDYFRITGVVKPEQNNFAGIGATGPDNPGSSFDTPRDGVLAHLQHLYAYATDEPLPKEYPLIDPRFDLVDRG